MKWPRAVVFVVLLVASASAQVRDNSQFRFRSGVELVNVTATVLDADGRFVPNLTQNDFAVWEDDKPVEVTHFSAERVPVSLGIALDTSGSMAGERIEAARAAIRRFVNELLDANDELFLYRFSNYPVLVQGWTRDRRDLLEPVDRLQPNGATALYDCVSRAIPLAQQGQNQKKALVIISDGNDTSSRTDIRDLKEQIRQSEVLVYAVGIDADGDETTRRTPSPPRIPIPRFPGGIGRGGIGIPPSTPFPPVGGTGGTGGGSFRSSFSDRVNISALRDMTDDSGGRTEVIRTARDLDPATAGIADELSKQYYLAYSPPEQKDGRWHTIRVDVKGHSYRVRARRGYFAS